MESLDVGTVVEWSSHGGKGGVSAKRGKIVRVILPGVSVFHAAETVPGAAKKMFGACSGIRKETSYLVRVDSSGAPGLLYWPRTALLKRVGP